MERRSERKIILVVRRTRLEELIHRYNSRDQAKFYIEHLGGDFSDYQREHDQYHQVLREAERALAAEGRIQVLDRDFLPNFLFGPADTVVVLGQDGLVVNTAKYLDGQLIVGVNPDPDRWDGVLLPFRVGDLKRVMPGMLAERRGIKEVTMAQATLNTGQRLYAINDLFIGQRTHTSARYQIRVNEQAENQSSSGIIVSTGFGCTGWLKSVLAGAARIASHLGQGAPVKPAPVPWDAPYLFYSVREPFPSKTTGTSLVFGQIPYNRPVQITSFMPENGVIFSDGVERDFLEFNAGTIAEIGVAERRARLVV